MMTLNLHQYKRWLQHHENPNYRKVFYFLKRVRAAELPTPKFLNRLIYGACVCARDVLANLSRLFIYTPAFKGRVEQCGKRLYLYSGLPFTSGPLKITVGDDCRISGQTTLSGRSASLNTHLSIGNNVAIGWQTTIAVGNEVIIEDDVAIAGQVFLFGYSGHPLDPVKRAQGLPDDEHQVGKIHLKRGVWLASNVSVCSGVTIGEGTVVATGSVVTKDLPANVLAAGNPARVIRSLDQEKQEHADTLQSINAKQGVHHA